MITHNSLHKFFTLDFLKIKLFLIILLLSFNYNFAQRENLIIEEELIDKTQDLYNLSPDGVLETIFDQYGKKYKLEDIFINALPSNTATLISCSSTSYFNLYFEAGCGMEDTSNPEHNARRAVVCKVFEDISNFIDSPLSSTGNKVNIWIRNINNAHANPSSVLGFASSFFNVAGNTGGIVDGEIWKTIHTGYDSYSGIATPLVTIGSGSSLSGTFYHGMLAFNFNDTATPPIPNITPIIWNTNLTSTTIPFSQYDLYSIMLHEVAHSLGFGSLIDENGNSKFGVNYRYYSRYDTYLKTNNQNNFLLTQIGCGSMTDYGFNSSLSPTILRPNPLSQPCQDDVTNCSNAIKFVKSTVVPVFTPNCFMNSSSLSHFEDTHFPTCNTTASGYGNNNYFLMCNAMANGKIRRYLKPEERLALCDIGYKVKSTYGSSSTFGGYYNYGGTTCNGINVAGINDGIASTGTYSFSGIINTNITIPASVILGNDFNATGFECLQDLTATATFPTTFLTTSGTSSTNITFNSGLVGLHLLRYIPTNGTQKGNITYIYVNVNPTTNPLTCAPTYTVCNMVGNGNFEENNLYLTQPTFNETKRLCGWFGTTNSYSPPLYFLQNTVSQAMSVPCNTYGYQNDNISGNKAYSGVSVQVFPNGFSRTNSGFLGTTLPTDLQPNTTYQLSFNVSVADFARYRKNNLQAFISSTPKESMPINSLWNYTASTFYPAYNTGILLTDTTLSFNSDGWDTISFTFTTGSNTTGMKYLYLGKLTPDSTVTTGVLPSSSISGCVNNFNVSPQTISYYYIDNVSLIATGGAGLNLPEQICVNQTITNLAAYFENSNPDGIFSGNGVALNGNVYSFSSATPGYFTIGYTYTNANGCIITLYDTINVTNTSTNSNTVTAVNDNLTSYPINTLIGGVTTSVYTNDIFNSLPSTLSSTNQVTFELVAPLAITGATINNLGYISVPVGTPAGSYTLTYKISVLGNCNAFSTATVQILVVDNNVTPTLVAGIRANDTVLDIEFQSSGKSIIIGNFTKYNNVLRNGIARLNTDVTLDTSFYSSGSNVAIPIQDLAVQSDNKIIVVGKFTTFSGGSNGDNIARLLPDGAIDTSFNVGGTGITSTSGVNSNVVYATAVLPDGKILVAGDFNYYNGIQRYSIVRLNTNGSIDMSFTMPSPYGYKHVITDILVQTDGRIVLSGFFNTPSAKRVVRLMSDGSFDTSFTQGDLSGSIDHNQIGVGGYPISKLIAQPDGKILVVGAFTKYNGVDTKSIVRLNTNGSVDTSFITAIGVERKILEVMLESGTNKILIGGEFTSYNGTPIKKIIRLNTNGTHDTTFSIGSGTTDAVVIPTCPYCRNNVWALKQQPDGKIMVGGSFTTFNGLSAMNITRIYGNVGVQAKNSSIEYISEPEIDAFFEANAIAVYPNPSTSIFNFDLSGISEECTLVIYSILGEKIIDTKITPNKVHQVDLSHLSNGCYIARIVGENANTQHKLIKN